MGSVGALIVAGILIIISWGVVWLRLGYMGLRPEFAVLSILPQAIYFVEQQTHSGLFVDSVFWQNMYALIWMGFAGVSLVTVRLCAADGAKRSLFRDPVYLLISLLIVIYTISTFGQYYPTLTH